ncbi:MAG: hypothetical protein HY815_10725 [Candidatus Riflebacteria bacterium]|nr:hypothetical protein [Candidatus Riflebacteria bacterium]
MQVARFLFVLFFYVALSITAVQAGGDPGTNDKIRLSSAVPSPVPLIFGGPSTLLRTVTFQRLTDGLGSTDSPGKGSKAEAFRFCVELTWEIQAVSGGAAVSRLTTTLPIVLPYTYQELPADPTLPVTATGVETKTFVRTEPWLPFDGRGLDGELIAPGDHPWCATARFLRFKQTGTLDKVIGVSGVVRGTILVFPRPDPPSVDPVPALTNVPLVALSGTKPVHTALLVNGVERVALSPSTTWNTTKTLIEGPNSISFSDRDAFGNESFAVTVRVTLDATPPAAPEVSVPPEVTSTRTQTLSGTKEPGSAILINGVVVVSANDRTTWSVPVVLQEGVNQYLVECMDAAGNKSLAAGNQVAQVAHEKPVIGELLATPPEVEAGTPVQIQYRLFAQVPPQENAALRVLVRIEDGDRVIRTVFSGVQPGDPTGLPYTTTWDGREDTGQPVAVNTSYRVVVSADRVSPATMPPELADANAKETAVVVIGSQHASSRDGKLQLVFRPDDARVTITRSPVLSAEAGRRLAVRELRPAGGCYLIEADRALTSPVVGLYIHGSENGQWLRPVFWDEAQQDWTPISRANWNPTTGRLSFALPGPGLIVLASSQDAQPPTVTQPVRTGSVLQIHAMDRASGVNATRLRLRQQRQEVTGRTGVQLVNGVHDVLLTVNGFDPQQGPLELYVEDWAGNGHLHVVNVR